METPASGDHSLRYKNWRAIAVGDTLNTLTVPAVYKFVDIACGFVLLHANIDS